MVIEIVGIVGDIVKEKDIDGNRDRGGAIRDKSAFASPAPSQRPYLISVQHLPNCCSSTLPDPQLLYFVWFPAKTCVWKIGVDFPIVDLPFLNSIFSKALKIIQLPSKPPVPLTGIFSQIERRWKTALTASQLKCSQRVFQSIHILVLITVEPKARLCPN